MTTTEKSTDQKEYKLLTVMSYYNQGHTIHEACKLASVSLHSYYHWRKMNAASYEIDMIPNEPTPGHSNEFHVDKSSDDE